MNCIHRRSVLIHGNVLRVVGMLLHFGELGYRTYYPLTMSSSPHDALSAEEEPISCGCVYDNSGENETSKEIDNSTSAASTQSSESAHTTHKQNRVSDFDISLWSKCINGMYSGMSSFLAILYLYEIAPKSTRIHSVAVLALYFLLTTAIKYAVEMGVSPRVMYASTADLCSWATSGALTLSAMVLQLILLMKFCPESPSYLVHHRKDTEKAKKGCTTVNFKQ